MALSYATIFGDIGKVVKHINLLEAVATTTLPTAESEIITAMGAIIDPIGTIVPDVDQMQGAVNEMRRTLAAYINSRLTDRTTVLDELRLDSTDINEVLFALGRQMLADSESILNAAVTLGSVSAVSGNVGNATILTTKTLDGLSNPGEGMPSMLWYAGLASELAASQTMTVECTADSYADGQTAGSEALTVSGGLVGGGPESHDHGGAGRGPTMQTLNAETLVSNGAFDEFVSNVPTSWTADAGTAGTHIRQSTSESYRGGSSLRLTGDGSLAAITLSQAPVGMKSRTGYLMAIAVKADASIAAGQLTVQFTGTGYTAASSEKIVIAAASLPTSWTVYSAYIVTPAVLPADWDLQITWTGTPTNTKNLYLDSLVVGQPTWHGGVGIGVVAGSTDMVRGDRWTFTVSNNGASAFQQFFRRFLGVQMPSNASPSQANSLAT